MDKILKRYGDMIDGWDSDVGIGENPEDVYYWVWVKRPWVMKIDGEITDSVDCELPERVMELLKTAYKDEKVWDIWENKEEADNG